MSDNTGTVVSKKATLVIICLSSFVMSFLTSALNVAIPTIGRELAMEAVLMGWITASYMLTLAVCQVPVGRLADIYGQKKMFLCGLILVIISAFFCAISNSAIMLILSRVLQGIGASMIFCPILAILSSVFPAGERGRAIGIHGAIYFVGFSIGPFLGGVLTEHLGWRSIFYLAVALGVASVILVVWKLKGEWAEARGESFDIVGTVALSVAIGAGMYGFSVLPDARGMVLVLVGIISLLAFVRWEGKMENPLLNVALLRKNTVFVFSSLATLASYCATYAVTFFLSLYLQYTRGLSPQTAGLVLIILPVLVAILAPISGRLSDRFEARKVAAFGMAFSCLALLLFIFLDEKTSLGFVMAGLSIMGLGTGFFATPNVNAVMGSVDKKFLGVASGVWGTMRTSGMVLSMGIVMILFSIYIGEAQITPEYYPAFLTSMRVGFIIFTVLCFGAIFTQLAGREVRQV